MQWLLIAVVLIGACYFLGVRRRLDAFTVAFFSASIYFLPGMVGYALRPVSSRTPISLPVALEPEAIGIMLAVTALILVGAVLWDQVDRQSPAPSWVLEESRIATWFALILGFVGLILTAVETGGAVFTEVKAEVIRIVGRGHSLWQVGATVGVALAFVQRQRLAVGLGWVLLLLDVWIGFRSAFATTFIAVALLWFSQSVPIRLGLIRLRYWVLTLVIGGLIFFIKNTKEILRAGDWDLLSTRLSDPIWYLNEILSSEPFVTQTVLNEIVRTEFRTSFDHLASAGYNLILFSPELGRENVGFNSLFQPALFPFVEFGLANNIWAQMWSAGGWSLLLGFVLVFLVVLAFLCRLLRSADPAVKAYSAVAVAHWAFYIHRNELQVAIQSQKMILMVWVACVCLAIALTTQARRSGRHDYSGALRAIHHP